MYLRYRVRAHPTGRRGYRKLLSSSRTLALRWLDDDPRIEHALVEGNNSPPTTGYRGRNVIEDRDKWELVEIVRRTTKGVMI